MRWPGFRKSIKALKNVFSLRYETKTRFVTALLENQGPTKNRVHCALGP